MALLLPVSCLPASRIAVLDDQVVREPAESQYLLAYMNLYMIYNVPFEVEVV